MYYLVARGVNPLALTKEGGGGSALLYAVRNESCPQRMVAECVRLGFSTHQLQLTGVLKNLMDVVQHVLLYDTSYRRCTSPLLSAVLRGLPVVTRMLYESGSCSYKELLCLYTDLPKLVNPETEEGKSLKERLWRVVRN